MEEGKTMAEIPLEAATADVIARYNRGNDMLVSCASALRRLKDRVDAGEAGPDWDWPKYRRIHLEPHIKKRWINTQLQLAPPGATEIEVAKNVAQHRESTRVGVQKSRALRNAHLTRTSEHSQPEPEYEDPVRQVEDDREGDGVVTASDIVRDPVLLEDVLDSSVTADRADNEAPTPVATGGRTDGEMLSYMGMDAEKWAAEFCRIAGERGQQNLDAGWVLGWFANAIETARDVGRATVATPHRADESRVMPPHEGMIGYWLDPHNHARNLPAGLTLAMNASKELTPAEAVTQWPEAMPLLSEDINTFADWVIDFHAAWKAEHGVGNDAGLQAAE
jgi:hypothetical protein